MSVSPDDFFEFVCAYFHGRIESIRRESSHFVIAVRDLPDNISIPTNLSPIPDRIFGSLLRSIGVTPKQFTALAGTPRKLKQYRKSQRREE